MCLRTLKGKLVFLLGFFIGFICTIVLFSINNDYQETNQCMDKPLKLCSSVLRSIFDNGKRLTKNINVDNYREKRTINIRKLKYNEWLLHNNVTISKVNLDLQQYGPNSHDNYTTELIESEWLKLKVNIICVVFVEKIKLAKSIKDTWGVQCNKIYFFSQNLEDPNVPIVKPTMKLTSSWQMLCEAMHNVWNTSKNDSLEWVIFVKDDTMVLPENLRYLVASLDYNNGYYLGHPIVLWGQPYNVAQAGYVLSRGAFHKIIETFNSHEKCISGGRYWKKEDYYLSKHLAQLNIYPSDTRDHYLRGTFHGYSLQNLLWGVAKPGNYFTRALYPSGRHCCSPKSITFTVSEPDKLYTLNYMLYHLHVYYNKGIYGNKPAPTPVPEDEIWKLALKEEFNLTDVDDITDDRFYKIWRSRYSEPLQFINKNYQNIPGILDSILTAYESNKKISKQSTLT